MFRSPRFMAAIAAAICLWPAAAGARAEVLTPSDVADPPKTVEQLRTAFSARGFNVDPAYTWGWTLPPVTSFRVLDPSNERVLLVLVYGSATDAEEAQLRAQARDPHDGAPYLVPGYGRSVWSGNVAMVQTTLRDLDHVARIAEDRNSRMHFDQSIPADAVAPTIAVDLDFQEALQNATANV